MKYFLLFCVLFFGKLSAQSLKFTKRFGADASIYFDTKKPESMDSIKRMVKKTLKKNECVIITPSNAGPWFFQYTPFIVNGSFDTLIVPGAYTRIKPLGEKLFAAQINYSLWGSNQLWGILTLDHKIYSPFKWSDISELPFHGNDPKFNSLFVISDPGQRKGLFDIRKNRIIIPAVYQDIWLLNGTYFVAAKDQKYGIISLADSVILPFAYRSLGYYWQSNSRNAIPAVNDTGAAGMINYKGEVRIPFIYREISYFDTQFAYYKNDSSHGFIEIATQKKMPFDKSQASIRPAPKAISTCYVPLRKHKYEYTLRSKTTGYISKQVVKQTPNWRNPNDPEDVIDTLWYVRDTVPLATNTDSLRWSGWFQYIVPLDSMGADSILQPEEILKRVISEFQHSLEDVIRRDLPEYAATRGFHIHRFSFAREVIMAINKDKKDSSYRAEALRWCLPSLKEAFMKMPEFYREEYQKTAAYLINHLKTFQPKKLNQYLQNHESKFAWYDPYTGKWDERRRLSAFVDRMILVHHYITLEEARSFFLPLCYEMLKWK